MTDLKMVISGIAYTRIWSASTITTIAHANPKNPICYGRLHWVDTTVY